MHEIVEIINGYREKIGQVIGETKAFTVTQTEIDVFGHLTGNPDPMHNDPEWGVQGPWGSTIAHGLHILSFVSRFWKEIGVPIYTTDKMYSLNYGFEKVRYPEVFNVDVPAKATLKLLDVVDKGNGSYLLPTEVTVRQEGKEKPTMVAVMMPMIVTT